MNKCDDCDEDGLIEYDVQEAGYAEMAVQSYCSCEFGESQRKADPWVA